MKRKLQIIIGVMVLTLVLGLQTNGHATPTLQLIDWSTMTTVTVVDNVLGLSGYADDKNPVLGAVTFVGSIGDWYLNISTGLTKPVSGSASLPEMDLNSVNVSSATDGNLTRNLTISFSDTGFSGGTGNMNMIFQAGGTTGGGVSFQAKVDLSNQLFGGASFSNLPDSGSDYTGAFSGTTFPSYVPNDNYSLTIVADIVHTSAGSTSFDVELIPVPEPATLLLLGLGLMGVAGIRKKITE